MPTKQKKKSTIMKTKKTAIFLGMAGLVSLSLCASAQVTLSGTQLAGLTYDAYNQTPTYNGTSASAAYSSGVIDLSALYFPGTGGNQYWANVTVPNGYDGVSLGTLNNFISSGSTFDLQSLSGSYQNQIFGNNMISAYWNVTLNIPAIDGGGTVTYSSAADGVLGANTFDQPSSLTLPAGVPSPLDYYTGSGPYTSLGANEQINPNNIDTWADLASTEGTWTVASVGVEIGNWSEVYSTDANIDSFTLGGDADPGGVPDAGSTLPLLGVGFGALACLRWRLYRA
jgi:hypothetical protein